MGGAVVRNKYVWIFGASPPGPIVGAHLYSACKTGHVAPRPRRFRCETIGNVRYRIPRGRITRTLRANVKRTRRRERGIRHEPKWNFLASLRPFLAHLVLPPPSLSLSLSLTFRSSGSDASAWRMVIVLDRSKWFRSLGRTERVRANYFESKHDLPEQFISKANVVTFPLSNLTLFLDGTFIERDPC